MKVVYAPLLVFSLGILGYATFASPSNSRSPEVVSFDKQIMPILGQKCFKCHGPDVAQVAGNLRLDSIEGAKHAISPGHPESSKLIARVSAQDPADRMPPQDSGIKPLSRDQIETLTTWIRQGAKYEKHWSFVPPQLPKVPQSRETKWPKNEIDQFVFAKLQEQHLKPEPEADKDTLALRAAEAITGLPPTPDILRSFRQDHSAQAYEKLVDKLLGQPSYGEQQTRYWLDAVRYGDTHGLQLDNERAIFPYRDWVVRAFNDNLPYDKFLTWQLAGDLLPKPTTDQIVATGYVRCNLTSDEGGAIEEEFLARNTFDRVDTTSTVLLGLTVQCAKCHDHKYDPIKQKDYYGLYAYFDSTTDKPLDNNETFPAPVAKAPSPDQAARLATLSRDVVGLRNGTNLSEAASYFTAQTPPNPVARNWQISPIYSRPSFDEAFDAVEQPEVQGESSVNWKPFDYEPGKDAVNIIGKDNSSVYVRATVQLARSRQMTFGVSSDDAVKVWLNGKLIHSHKVGRALNKEIDPVTGDFRQGDNQLLVKVVNGISTDGLNVRLYDVKAKKIEDAVKAYRAKPTDEKAKEDLATLYLEFGPTSAVSEHYKELVKEQSKLESEIPMTLVAQEMPSPRPTFILKRGQYDQKGDAVTRHIPLALGETPTSPAQNRLTLAQWMTSKQNPLVARVYVNRVWQQYFGVGIVKTAEDFGSQGEWPVNQELLDYLAVKFVQSGWNIKALDRMIATSAAFRQSAKITAEKLNKDPENRLISRGPRFRLDAEAIRDKALFASGLLVQSKGGRGFKPYQPDGIWENASDPASSTHIYVRDKNQSIYQRSLYMFWKRTAPPPAMVNLDAPLRDTCIVRRSVTNTPTQALTLENEPSFLEAARVMAQHLLSRPANDEARLKQAFELTLGRAPRPSEFSVLTAAFAKYRRQYDSDKSLAQKMVNIGDAPFSAGVNPADQAAWMIICSTLMNTDEFLTQH